MPFPALGLIPWGTVAKGLALVAVGVAAYVVADRAVTGYNDGIAAKATQTLVVQDAARRLGERDAKITNLERMVNDADELAKRLGERAKRLERANAKFDEDLRKLAANNPEARAFLELRVPDSVRGLRRAGADFGAGQVRGSGSTNRPSSVDGTDGAAGLVGRSSSGPPGGHSPP
jgi:PPE-repeat protein